MNAMSKAAALKVKQQPIRMKGRTQTSLEEMVMVPRKEWDELLGVARSADRLTKSKMKSITADLKGKVVVLTGDDSIADDGFYVSTSTGSGKIKVIAIKLTPGKEETWGEKDFVVVDKALRQALPVAPETTGLPMSSNAKGLAAFEEMKNFEGAPWSISDAAKKLGIVRNTVYSMIRSKTLVAFPDSLGRPCIPVWQFNEEGRVLPGVSECLKVLDGPEWANMRFFLAKRSDLGKSPLELLRENKIEEVVTLAKDSNPAP